jgi:hypothetical protein
VNVFLIHRSNARKTACSTLKKIATEREIVLRPITLVSGGYEDPWHARARAAIESSEAVVVYDPSACTKSANASWEIEEAKRACKPLIMLNPGTPDESEISKLVAIYHNDEEFKSYFFKAGADGVEFLYKTMVESSEQLIQRRQRMNAFFITAMGSLLAIAGALTKFGPRGTPLITLIVAAGFGVAGLMLCNSWRNLINNYGKLNRAKFRVITKLEEALSARIFAAEWAALGKGRRPSKYQSFTATENRVPLWFALLLFGLMLLAIGQYVAAALT